LDEGIGDTLVSPDATRGVVHSESAQCYTSSLPITSASARRLHRPTVVRRSFHANSLFQYLSGGLCFALL